MAKVVRLPAGVSLGEAMERLVPALLDRVLACEDAVRAGEPEDGVHRMRVALKRFRESFRLFAPVLEGRGFRKQKKAVERLNDVLGAVRDRDVLSEHLGRLAPEEDPARRALERDLVAERSVAFAALLECLDAFLETRQPDRIRRRVLRRAARASGQLAPFATDVVASRLSTLRDRLAHATVAPTPDALHALRIASKKLRYALEPFVSVLPEGADEAEARAEALQEVLGAVHDLDVLESRVVRGLLAAERAQRGSFTALLARLEDERRSRLVELAALHDGYAPDAPHAFVEDASASSFDDRASR